MIGLSAWAASAWGQSAPQRVLLTWPGDPATRASVTWRTPILPQNSRIEWVRASADPRFVQRVTTQAAVTTPVELDPQTQVFYHRVELSGLQPNTRYSYRVGNDRAWSEWFDFRTAAREFQPFRFLYLGDAQNDIYSLWSRTLRAAVLAAPDARFVMHAGDLVDVPNRDSDWDQWFRGGDWIHASIPVVASIGNHEYFRSGENRLLSILWRPQFNYPNNGLPGLEETSYVVDHMGVRIVVLNAMAQLEAQARWLDQVLAQNRQRWTVVMFHHPIYSTAKNRDNPSHRRLWQPVLEKHRVDLVLQGHDHTYGRRTGPNGYTQYVVSVAGPKMYELNAANVREMHRAADYSQLYQMVSVKADRIRFESRLVTGELYDGFELIKPVGQAKGRMVNIPPQVPARTSSMETPSATR